MTDNLIHAIDDQDREAARDAADRARIKAKIGAEALVEQLIAYGLENETPIPDKINILRELNTITAAGERAKREVSQEMGSGDEDNRPVMIINIPGRQIEVGAKA